MERLWAGFKVPVLKQRTGIFVYLKIFENIKKVYNGHYLDKDDKNRKIVRYVFI